MATCRLGTKSEELNTRIELILTLWFKVDNEGLKCLQQLKDKNRGSKKEAILFYLHGIHIFTLLKQWWIFTTCAISPVCQILFKYLHFNQGMIWAALFILSLLGAVFCIWMMKASITFEFRLVFLHHFFQHFSYFLLQRTELIILHSICIFQLTIHSNAIKN